MSVSIADMDKAEVLHALYNASHPQGMSFMGVTSGGVAAARAIAALRERLAA